MADSYEYRKAVSGAPAVGNDDMLRPELPGIELPDDAAPLDEAFLERARMLASLI